MLPDFPTIKSEIAYFVNQVLRAMARDEPLLSQIKQEHHLEGDKWLSYTVDGEADASKYLEGTGEFTITRQDIISKGPAAFIESVRSAAEQLKEQQAKMVFKKLDEITSKTGNVVKGTGAPFTPEDMFRALEKVHIDFDEEGKPHMPTMVVSPQLGAYIKVKLPEWKANDTYNKKFDDILRKKKAEWHAREDRRKLVD